MAKETMQLGEAFAATKIGALPIETPKTRHRVIGWSLVAVLLGGLIYGGCELVGAAQEGVGLKEGFKTTKIKALHPAKGLGGILGVEITHKDGTKERRAFKNQIVNAGETALRDCFGGTGTPSCTATSFFRYHGLGTSAVAIAETDTGCTTELTTQYNPDGTRATGSQTNNGANIYRTIGTNTFDAAATIAEFCLMNQALTGGTMWTRILTGSIAVVSGDSIQTTYDLTIE